MFPLVGGGLVGIALAIPLAELLLSQGGSRGFLVAHHFGKELARDTAFAENQGRLRNIMQCMHRVARAFGRMIGMNMVPHEIGTFTNKLKIVVPIATSTLYI